MAYPQEYIEFLVHFHGSRDYFECHEIIEEYWKKVDRENKNSIWVGLIQLAVSQYHHRRGNLTGAYKTLQKSLHIFQSQPEEVLRLGLDQNMLIKQLEASLSVIEQKQNYESQNLPITSRDIMTLCLERSRELHINWGSPSNMSDAGLVHRHKKRDRTQVIRERDEALRKRQIKETNPEKKE
jgi:predicted metal-dependent hydrolase